MAFNIPNVADAAFARQSCIFASGIDGLVSGHAGDGVLSGCGVTAQASPDTTVAVAAGLIRIQGYFCYVAAANVTGFTGDATNPRIDLVTVDYNGNLTRTAGTAAAQPVSPAIPANSICLAQVYLPANDVTMGSNQIIDKRVLLPDQFDLGDDFMGGSINSTQATRSGCIGGVLGLGDIGAAATPAFQTSVAGHPGVLRAVTGATTNNNRTWCFGGSATQAILDPTNVARARFIVSIPTITSISVKLGVGQDLSDAAAASLGTAGAFVEFVPATSAKWRYNTRQGGTPTTNADTGADVVAGNWYQFDIVRKQNGDWQFAKNGALAFTHSNNQPTTVCTFGVLVQTLTTAARNLDVDFIGFNFAPISSRFT